MPHYHLFINGKWTKSHSAKTFESLNPATGKPIGTFEDANVNDLEHAIKSAKEAYPAWRDTPAPVRGKLLLRFARLLEENKERLAQSLTEEMGKAISEARGDVQEAIDIAEYMAGEGRRLFGHTTTSELPNKFAMTIRQPIGVVGVITPWNFPIAIPAWKICPALICGNTVVFKPSSDTPRCATEFMKLLIQAGLPPGVVNLVTGSAEQVGQPMVKHPDVHMISFTGSHATGEWIVKNAGIKKIGLELGGKNPIIIMDDADLNLALDGVIFGAFATTGQRCTAASRVIIHQKIFKKFEQMLVAKTKKLKVGNGISPKTDVGPVINSNAIKKIEYYCELGKKEKSKLLIGGKKINGPGNFFEPTVFSNVSPKMTIAKEEIFGPVVALISVKNFDEAIKVANATKYGLSSSIYTQNITYAFRAIREIEAGLTYVNSSTDGSEAHLPFGGVKGTGNGTREAGIEGINEFSETKTVYVDYSGKLQKAQIETFKPK